MLECVAALALGLAERFSRRGDASVELRGGIALGVVGGAACSAAVERYAERLVLAAAPGQWLVAAEVSRRLHARFELRGVGVVPRWPLSVAPTERALVAPLVPPVLGSAVAGETPTLVLGRHPHRRRLRGEFRAAAAGRRRVVLVTAPAGGGKSHLLRSVLADGALRLGAGVAFPSLGGMPLAPIGELLAELGVGDDDATQPPEGLGARLATAAGRAARAQPVAIVVDDIHWADDESLAALETAIARSESNVPLAWVLSARTSAVARLGELARLADAVVALPPLAGPDRVALLAARLGTVPEQLRRHVARGDERGNPLYLEHLAAALSEGAGADALPGTLHEAILTRLDSLVTRARALTRRPRVSASPRADLETLERELGDWLDRLETSDVAELATIGRYLGRLRHVDLELVVARSLLGIPVTSNRRLAQAIERLAAASTDALLDYVAALAREGRARQAVQEADAAAQRAELALRLDAAERLLALACEHDAEPSLLLRRGDLALALGRPEQAFAAYGALLRRGEPGASLHARIARVEATTGRVDDATHRLERALGGAGIDPADVDRVSLDLARLRGSAPPISSGRRPATLRRRAARVASLADPGDRDAARRAARLLALDGPPAMCATELIETAAIARVSGVEINGLPGAAERMAAALNNTNARTLNRTTDIDVVRRTFLHWDA